MDKLTLRILEIGRANGFLPLHPKYLTLCQVWQIEALYIAGIASLDFYDVRSLREKIDYIERREKIDYIERKDLDLSPDTVFPLWSPPQSILDKFSWQTSHFFNIY